MLVQQWCIFLKNSVLSEYLPMSREIQFFSVFGKFALFPCGFNLRFSSQNILAAQAKFIFLTTTSIEYYWTRKKKSQSGSTYRRNIHPCVGESLHHFWKRMLEAKNKEYNAFHSNISPCFIQNLSLIQGEECYIFIDIMFQERRPVNIK